MSARKKPIDRPVSRICAAMVGDDAPSGEIRGFFEWGRVILNDMNRAFILTADAETGEFVLKIHRLTWNAQNRAVMDECLTEMVFQPQED